MKDRRLLKVHLPLFVFREWGMKTAKLLMEDFLVIEAINSLANDEIQYAVWHPDANELAPGFVLPMSSWVFTEKREGGELVQVMGSVNLGNGKLLAKTINFNRTVEAEKPAYDKEEFSV